MRRVPITYLDLSGEGVAGRVSPAVFDQDGRQPAGSNRGLGAGCRRRLRCGRAPATPAWQERITGVPREQTITIARQFADNADKTHGKSMVIGAA